MVTSYFIGSQSLKKDSVKISESYENPAAVNVLQSAQGDGFSNNTSEVDFDMSKNTSNNIGQNSNQNLSENNQESLIKVSLKIEDKNYETEISKESSAYELMQELKMQGLQFSGLEYAGIGFYVTEINGLKEDKKSGLYWTLYINEKESNVGVSSLILKDGDSVEWKYENRNKNN